MTKNSTLLLIRDDIGGESELIDIDEWLDPEGIYGLELDSIFEKVSFTPRQEIIENILRNA